MSLRSIAAWRAAPALRRAGREARRWGLPGALGTLLLLAGAAFVLLAVLARQALQADERALHAARVRAAAALAQRERAPEQADPARAFAAAFPPEADRHRRVTNLLSLASGMGLQPRRSELRSLPEADLGLARVRVVLPLAGSYAQLRRFVEQALRDDPALSLDLLRLERSDPAAPELRAELQWSVWVRAADTARSAP